MSNSTARQWQHGEHASPRETPRDASEHDLSPATSPTARDSARWPEESAAAQGDLLGRISHELRSPLATIRGYAATLRRHERRLSLEERREYLSAIEDATSRLDTIVERMLLLAQLESGSVIPVRAPVDVGHLVCEAVTAAQTTAMPHSEAHPLHLAVLIDSTCVVDADPRLLRVVLDQLIENAIKFSSASDAIEVAVRQTESAVRDPWAKALPVVEVTVQNTGRVIPPEHIERIFERFHQADSGLTREVGGLGLGLAICQRILVLHGGTLAAHSGVDGSTFTLRLPLGA